MEKIAGINISIYRIRKKRDKYYIASFSIFAQNLKNDRHERS